MCFYALWHCQRTFCNAPDLDSQCWWKTKKININILIAKGGLSPFNHAPRAAPLDTCTLRASFPVWRGTFKVSNWRENMFIWYRLCHFQIFIHSSVNIIFKIMLVGKYIFVIFLNLFVIRNFMGRKVSPKGMLIYRNAEGVHGQRKFGNTCPKPKPGQ